MSTINSLGIGSGVLTSDLLDQLREVDETNVIKPLENKITMANQQEDAYKLLESLMTTFKSSASALDGDTLYLSRSVTGNTDAVTVTAEAGSNVQDFSITDIDKAESDVWNSSSLSTKSTPMVDLGSGTLTITVDGEDFEIAYTDESSLNDIKDSINELASDKMTASVLQVGEDGYELVITAKDTNEAITFSDSVAAEKQLDTTTLTGSAADGDTFNWSDGTNEITVNLGAGNEGVTGAAIAAAINADETLNKLYIAVPTSDGFTIESLTDGLDFSATSDITTTGTLAATETTSNDADSSLSSKLQLNNIQVAEAATFKYNGIEISRDNNKINDLIVGVTIELNQNQEATDSASIKIAQNNTSISSEISLFVSNYNNLVTNLQDMTRSDRESGSVGIFNGDSFVKSISRDITSLITKTNFGGESLMDYGIDIDRDGVMSLDNDVFAKKYVTDASAMELFFSGNSTTDGIFTKLNTKMDSYMGYEKLMSSFSNNLDSNKENLVERHTQQKASLDARYAIMQTKFIAYDAMISRLNSQFSSMQMMINAEYADKD